MARHFVEIEKNEDFHSVGNSMNTEWKFENNILYIKWKNEIREFNNFSSGDLVSINCDGCFPEATKVLFPKKRNHKLMWIMSFSKDSRCNSLEEYNSKVNSKIREFDFYGFELRYIEGDNFKITHSNREDCGGVHHILAYVSENISKTEIVQMLHDYYNFRGFYFSDNFIRNYLKRYFNLAKEEIDFILTEENGFQSYPDTRTCGLQMYSRDLKKVVEFYTPTDIYYGSVAKMGTKKEVPALMIRNKKFSKKYIFENESERNNFEENKLFINEAYIKEGMQKGLFDEVIQENFEGINISKETITEELLKACKFKDVNLNAYQVYRTLNLIIDRVNSPLNYNECYRGNEKLMKFEYNKKDLRKQTIFKEASKMLEVPYQEVPSSNDELFIAYVIDKNQCEHLEKKQELFSGVSSFL